MSFTVIDNQDSVKSARHSGFRNAEFKKLAGLYSRAMSMKVMFDMGVDVNMDEGVCSFAYYRTANSPATLTFIVRHVGPRADMYELWLAGKGRIAKSGLFVRVFERLEQEIEALPPRSN